MRSFTYRSTEEKENLEAILRRRKKKINRQQLISGLILAVILATMLLYIGQKVYYTEYDGYMHADVNRIRAPYDMYIDSIYVTPGTMIHKGDTLFSYYIMDWLIMDVDPNSEPELYARRRTLTLQYTSVSQQIKVLDVRIEELKKQISAAKHNILFGLSDNAHKMDLERDLLESDAKRKALHYELGVLGKMLGDTNLGAKVRSGSKEKLQIYESPVNDISKEIQRHYIVKDDAFVIDVHAPIHTVFFEKENIVSLQHLDLQSNNLKVIAYIPVDKAGKINSGMKAEVIVNDELSFSAHVVIKGVRSEMIPENLRSFFAKQNTALIAVLEIDDGQVIPFWSATSGLPVKIRVKNYDINDLHPQNQDLHYEVGSGIITSLPERESDTDAGEMEAGEDMADGVSDTTIGADKGKIESESDDTVDTAQYLVISGVFGTEENAGRRVERLRNSGMQECGMIFYKGQWYVYLSSHHTRQEAEMARKKTDELDLKNRKTWILYTKEKR